MLRSVIIGIVVMSLMPFARGEIKTQQVEYKQGDVTLKGWLAYDDSIKDARPGVLVFPEWWGLNDYAKHRAEMLAGLGYVAFAADMYGDGKSTTDAKVAGEWSGAMHGNNELLLDRARAALDQLKLAPHVDASHLAAIGYCFGGTVALDLALDGASLTGVVAFHAALDMPNIDQARNIKGKVLVCTGGADAFVPAGSVSKFEDALQTAGVDVAVITYGGAHHAFTNPDADKFKLPNIGYNEPADRRSWQAMKEFFGEIFGAK